MRAAKEQKFKEILTKIKFFLTHFLVKETPVNVQQEYFLKIEQDSEKLIMLNESGVINVDIYEQVKVLFKIIIVYLEEKEFQTLVDPIRYILQDLYYIFRYIYENILFLIENEFLVDN